MADSSPGLASVFRESSNILTILKGKFTGKSILLFKYEKEKMNSVKKSFGIRDLENLSGIKAHTIRIWEKRYGLLNPERTETNIRTYSLQSLQKLLNVTLLYNNGYKISKIAEIPEDTINQRVPEIATSKTVPRAMRSTPSNWL